VDLGEVCDCNGDEDVALVIYGPNTFGSRDWLCVRLPILHRLPLTQSTPRNLEESCAVIEYIAAHGAEKGLKTERVRHCWRRRRR
jgi:hypothetical protein